MSNFNQENVKDQDKDIDASKSNGLITKIWGPPFWETLHCVSAGYPVEPTETDKKNYKEFFISVKNVLPCKFCRTSYEQFITTESDLILDDAVLESRDTLMLWVFKLHERVNFKLGITYNVTYEEVKDKLESYRAKCIKNKKSCAMPLNLKASSFEKANKKNAPVIDVKFYNAIKKYAQIRGIIFTDEILKLLTIDHTDKIWVMRDIYCVKLIKKMRFEAIPSVEPTGKYKNLPTILELKLIKMLSTNICCEELAQIVSFIDKLED